MLARTVRCICRQQQFCARFLSSDASRDERGRIGGILQWWKEPERYTPNESPLLDGPDFTFKDGRPTPFSTKKQLDKKLEQIELGNTIVRFLGEMNEAEELYEQSMNENEKNIQSYMSHKPRVKGDVRLDSKKIPAR